MNENENQDIPEEQPIGEQIPLDDPPGTDPELDAVTKERDEYLGLLKSKQAEFENYQKREAKFRDEERRYAVSPLAKELFQALDNLELAVNAAAQSEQGGALLDGVRAIQSQVLDTFRRFGITRIEAEGQPFGPNEHEAISQQPSAEVEPQTVLQVYQQGYRMHERVLRPARVVVSVGE